MKSFFMWCFCRHTVTLEQWSMSFFYLCDSTWPSLSRLVNSLCDYGIGNKVLFEPKNVCRHIFWSKQMETNTNKWNMKGMKQSSVIPILVQKCKQLQKLCTPIRDIPLFSNPRLLRKYELNSPHLARRYSWIFVKAHSFHRELFASRNR